jgi:putative membrane protein
MPMINMMWGGQSSPSRINPFNNNHMMYGFNNGMGGDFGFFGGIFMVLWWVLIIAAVVIFAKWLMRQGDTQDTRGKSAIDVLKERYARGEIDRKEFEEKKKDLM